MAITERSWVWQQKYRTEKFALKQAIKTILFVRPVVHKGVSHKKRIFITYFSSSSVKFYYTVADIA
jgi:hypothetical protein